MEHERFDEAETQFRLSMRLDPDFAPPFLGLFAMTYARWPKLWDWKPDVPADVLKKQEEVDRMLRHALVTDPLVDLRPLGAAQRPVPPLIYLVPELRDWYDTYGRGFNDLYDGKYSSALAVLNRLIAITPRRDSVSSNLLLWHGIAALHLRFDSVARRDFQRLANRESARANSDSLIFFPVQTADYDYLLATALYRTGDGPGAVQYYHSALLADAGLYVARTKLARRSRRRVTIGMTPWRSGAWPMRTPMIPGSSAHRAPPSCMRARRPMPRLPFGRR